MARHCLRCKKTFFATMPHSRISGRYQFISTLVMIEALDRERWVSVHVEESHVQLLEKRQSRA
jgi:hypothetical protein